MCDSLDQQVENIKYGDMRRKDFIFLIVCLNSLWKYICFYIEICGDGEMDYLYEWYRIYKCVYNEIVLVS